MNRTSSSNSAGSNEPFVLVGDVGGTNARFARFPLRAPGAEASVEVQGRVASGLVHTAPLATVSLPTAQFSSAEDLICDVREQLLGKRLPAACAIAIAGPVGGGVGKLTNGTLRFSDTELKEWLGAPAQLVNDFYAVAASINDATPVLPVGELTQPLQDVRAVLGPGTGLGMGYVVPDIRSGGPAAAVDWRVFASEGGNADFAPVDALELELLGILQREFATVSIETLVSGRGLPNLHAAVSELWGVPIKTKLTAEQISHGAIASENTTDRPADAPDADIVCLKTLELFCAMLGTAAGNFALNVGARGGVYLAGGILPQMQEFFCASDFRRRFDERGALSEFNLQIPTFLVRDKQPGLTGAVTVARHLAARVNR